MTAPTTTPLLTVDCVTINARSPWDQARFWASLVGGEPQDSGNGFVRLDPGPGRVPLLFQQTDQESADPGWIHLDCSGPDREAIVAAVEARGGRLVDRRSDSHASWVVLADPEGNLFCA